ncbi:MAG: hypothetical protein IJS65_00005, partial [Clostridia bacterium]|nr:hypothetical protein [Clostridia bacterium]
TYIKGIPFDSSVLTVTVASKDDTENKTVYTFNVTRPRDTSKTLKANTGLALAPGGRELLPTKYRGQPEGVFFRADENGTPATGTGISGTVYYYRAYAQNGLESFALKAAGSTEYTHLRYSSDGGNTWKELGQSGGMTEGMTFAPAGAENAAVKILVQVQDDASYVKNGGFTDECSTYAVWVEQLPAVADGEQPRILTAISDAGDWYPVFSPEKVTNYNIVTPNGASSVDLKYTVADGCTVKLGKKEQTPDGSGVYTLALKAGVQTLNVISADGVFVNSYGFKIQERSGLDAPDRVVDYLPINSQYTNISYGLSPEATLSGDLKSLGNFGGYITYYYENGIKDDPKNPYGIDFYVYGNAFIVETTGNKTGSAEPGQVWVSEDNVTYYALAGSEHYNDDTLWDYTVTYTRAPNGKTAWTDNYGNSNDGSARCGEWPKEDIYYLNENVKSDPIVLSGVLLPDENGNIFGDTSVRDIAFGYVDAYPNGTIGAEVNPYVKAPENSNGFDLLWAVNEKGEPADVAGKEFHYIKICTASNVWANAINEKSTEVTQMIRALPRAEEVGKTAEVSGFVISDGASEITIDAESGKRVYSVDVGDMKYVSVKLCGAAADDNVYLNNKRTEPDGALKGLKVTKEGGEKLVRAIVQNGEKEPCVYLLKLSGSATESSETLEAVKINAGGAVKRAETTDGKNYALTVGSRIEEISVTPVTAGAAIINGEEIKETYKLSEGENVFEIEVDGESFKLTVTREKSAASGDKTITVTFTLLGDDAHGENGTVHTYKKDKAKLKTWIPAKKYALPAGSAVVDLFNKALSEIGMSYTNKSGNYVSEVNGLSEF